MKRRTGDLPKSEDTFLWRICKALDEPPRLLASRLDIPYEELAPLLHPLNQISDIDRDVVWWKVLEHVDEKLGLVMAIRHELDKALQADRVRRALRLDRLKSRPTQGDIRDR